ncbi:MAG: hypothetical protein ITG01_04995 [Comamonas sp.]|nr:hypothetical protein [Comamonas sp.]
MPASVACALLLMMGLALAGGQVPGKRFNDTVYPLVFGLCLECLAAALASCTPVRRHGDPGAQCCGAGLV